MNPLGTSSIAGAHLARLDDVITTAELARRPARPPQHAEENRALIALARTMAGSPRSVLGELLSVALKMN